MKTWFKRRFPDDYLEKFIERGYENQYFESASEIKRAYAHIKKTEALLARAIKMIEMADEFNAFQGEFMEDLEKFKGGE
jgi:hypothetical protein